MVGVLYVLLKMKNIPYIALLALLPFSSVLADSDQEIGVLRTEIDRHETILNALKFKLSDLEKNGLNKNKIFLASGSLKYGSKVISLVELKKKLELLDKDSVIEITCTKEAASKELKPVIELCSAIGFYKVKLSTL